MASPQNSGDGSSRRALLAGIMAASPVLLLSQQAQAKDELFKGNPLTNSVLEQVCFGRMFERYPQRSDAVCAPTFTNIYAHMTSCLNTRL